MAGFLERYCHFSVSAKLDQPAIDVRHEDVALRIDHHARPPDGRSSTPLTIHKPP